MNALTEDFFVRHDEIDSTLMLIKKRVKIVNQRFLVLDIVVLVSLFCILFPSQLHEKVTDDELINSYIAVILTIVFAFLIASSANSIAKFVKT